MADEDVLSIIISDHVEAIPDHDHSTDWIVSGSSIDRAEAAAIAAGWKRTGPAVTRDELAEVPMGGTPYEIADELLRRYDIRHLPEGSDTDA